MSDVTTALERAIARLPRMRLAQLPTPLQPAPRLTKALGGPTIYIKRDELTGMPLAGNKTRMFEFVLPRIIASGADCVIGGAATQSNYCRQLTAACATVGLEAQLVLMAREGATGLVPQGNLLLDLLMGARVHLVEVNTGQEVIERMYRLADQLRAQGRKPFVARMANTQDLGLDAAAYANCALELQRQFEEQEIKPDAIYVASADTTQGGLVLGFEALGSSYRIVGINPIDATIFETPVPELVARAANKAADELGLGLRVAPSRVVNDGNYVGDGYGIPTSACLEAIQLVASHEGILLDPVYSGKAMAGLIDHIRRGILKKGEAVVFVHTGGYPALFAYNQAFDLHSQISVNSL